MMLRDVLVQIHGSQAGQRRARFALELATRFGAQLIGIHVTPSAEARPVYKPSVVAAAELAISRRLTLEAEAAEAIFREEIVPHMPSARWIACSADVVEAVCAHARYADLVILGQYEGQGPPERHPLPVAHSIVLRCGRPVLVIPPGSSACQITKIAIAWDGGREAVRAVHDALPFLNLAHTVDIITAVHPAASLDRTSARQLAQHLQHHGINIAEGARYVATLNGPRALRDELELGSYDLLVMGGYSHSMWREFVFGGITQSILLSSKIPVLVSH